MSDIYEIKSKYVEIKSFFPKEVIFDKEINHPLNPEKGNNFYLDENVFYTKLEDIIFEFLIEVKWKYDINGVRIISVKDNMGKTISQSYKVETYDINDSTQYASFKILKTIDTSSWKIYLYQDSGIDLDAILNVKLIGPLHHLNSNFICGCPRCNNNIDTITDKIDIIPPPIAFIPPPPIINQPITNTRSLNPKPVKKPAKKTVKKPVRKTVRKPVKKTARKAIRKPMKKAIRKPVKKAGINTRSLLTTTRPKAASKSKLVKEIIKRGKVKGGCGCRK